MQISPADERADEMNNRGNGVSRNICVASEGKYYSVRNRAAEKWKKSGKGHTPKGKTLKEKRKNSRKEK